MTSGVDQAALFFLSAANLIVLVQPWPTPSLHPAGLCRQMTHETKADVHQQQYKFIFTVTKYFSQIPNVPPLYMM